MVNVMDRKIKSFEDLEVWKFCRDLRNTLTDLAKSLPGEEKYRLTDQMVRAARSVTNNVAEGYGRFHYKESMQFYRQSRGSLYELIDHLDICQDQKYIKNDQFIKYKEQCTRGIKLINGYIRYLSKQKEENK